MRRATRICILLAGLFLTACVTVNLPSARNQHADGVVYPTPPAPFVSDSRADVDAAWKNPQNGNVISYLSDCHDAADPSRESIINGVLAGIHDLKIASKDSTTHQDRAATRVLADGSVDGVGTRIDLFVFKRNSCIYILTYVGEPSSFDADHARFDQFLQGFKAP